MRRTGVFLMSVVLVCGIGGFIRADDENDPERIKILTKKLRTARGKDRQNAIGNLIKMGKTSLPVINAVLLERDEELQKRIALLIKQLGHEDWKKREEAHGQLVSIGLKAVLDVTEGMKGDDPEVAHRCSQIKIAIEQKSAEEIAVRRRQFTALLFVVKVLADGSSLEALHKCCGDSEKDIRIAALDAVAAMADESSLDVLVELLDDDDVHVHLLAGTGIARIRSDGAKAAAVSMLLDNRENVYLRRLAAIALRKYGDRKFVGELIRVMDDDSCVVRRSVFQTLRAISGLEDETFGYDWQGDSDESRAARSAAIAKWRDWWKGD